MKLGDKITDYVQLAVKGNKVAFERLMQQFYPEIASFVTGYQLDSLESNDVVQECFITAFKSIHVLQPPYNFRAWLYKIADNLAKDSLRKRKSMVSINSFDLAEQSVSDTEQNDRVFQVLLAIDKLTPLLHDTAKLFFLHGLSINHITRKLNIPAGTVKRRLFDAREFIRKEFLKMQNSEQNSNIAPMIEVTEQKEEKLSVKHDHLSMFYGGFDQNVAIDSVTAAKTYEYPGGLLDFVEVVTLKRQVKIMDTDLLELVAEKKKNGQPYDEPITTFLKKTEQGYETAFCAYLKDGKFTTVDTFESCIHAGILAAPFSNNEEIVDVVVLTIGNSYQGKCVRSVKFNQQTALESYWSNDGRLLLIRFYQLAGETADKELFLVNNHSRIINGQQYRLRYDIVHEII